MGRGVEHCKSCKGKGKFSESEVRVWRFDFRDYRGSSAEQDSIDYESIADLHQQMTEDGICLKCNGTGQLTCHHCDGASEVDAVTE
jgi:RecJ-like exonuclease